MNSIYGIKARSIARVPKRPKRRMTKAGYLSENIIDQLESLAQVHEGECELNFEIGVENSRFFLSFYSAYKVKPTPQFLDVLESMRLEYEVG